MKTLIIFSILLSTLFIEIANGAPSPTTTPTKSPSRQPSSQCTNTIFFESPEPLTSTGKVLDYCYTFNFSYGTDGVEACGFDFASTTTTGVYETQGTPAIMWYKRGGYGENGVGLKRNSNHEIPVDGMVQITTTDLINANSPRFNIGSTSGNEKFCVYGSNIKGQLGTTLLYESFLEKTFFYFPDIYRDYQYLSFTSCFSNIVNGKPAADILLQYITKLDDESCTARPTVKPTFVPTLMPSKQPFGPSQQPVYVAPTVTSTPSSRPTTLYPTVMPSSPTVSPSLKPTTSQPTFIPSKSPSSVPSFAPITAVPTFIPSATPSYTPSVTPTVTPSIVPTTKPSFTPTTSPSQEPITDTPTSVPTVTPTTSKPSVVPTVVPTVTPTTTTPSNQPTTDSPFISYRPSHPTYTPTEVPTFEPSVAPSALPSVTPTGVPSSSPSLAPSSVPSSVPSETPTGLPSVEPSYTPSGIPSVVPSYVPSVEPTFIPTSSPSVNPTYKPSSIPSSKPSISHTPTRLPTYEPTELEFTPTHTPIYSPTHEPTISPSMQPTATTAAPLYAPTFSPTESPVYQPTVLPTVTPTELPSVVPTEEPTYEPSSGPTIQPTKVPSKRPSKSPTSMPTYEPTTLGKGLVDKCTYDFNGYYVNSSLYSAFFIVHHVMADTTPFEFTVVGANETYVETVRCILAGNYSIESVKVNITDVFIPQTKAPSSAPTTSPTISNRRSLVASESTAADVHYIVEYQFPIPDDTSVSGAYDKVQRYFDGLTQQLTKNMKNQYFTAILRQYALENNITSFADSNTQVVPEIFGPYLKTNLPTSAPIADAQSASNGSALDTVWSKLAVILGTISGLLCILFGISMLYYYYIQRKRSREEDMTKWATEANDADITVHKKYKNGNGDLDCVNPAFKQRDANNNSTAAKRMSTVISSVVRRLSTYVTGTAAAAGTGSDSGSHTPARAVSNSAAADGTGRGSTKNVGDLRLSTTSNPLDAVRIESARSVNFNGVDNNNNNDDDGNYVNSSKSLNSNDAAFRN